MIKEIKKLIQEDKQLRLLLLAALLIQFITCLTQVGFYHPDQHFQIIEFSSYQLHRATGATHVWELTDFIRSTIQVYLFSAYTIACNCIHINDPYTQLTILRVLLGLAVFTLFNCMALYYFKAGDKKVLYCVLLLLNLSWLFPYIRTLFSSEIMGALFFFGAIFYYDVKRNAAKPGLTAFITGLLLALAFFFRFQMAFAIFGFGCWVLLFDRDIKKIFLLLTGFIIVSIFSVYLDCRFYHELIFTPYRYFYVNINQGVAASFGTSSFMVYIGVLIAVIATPPLSIVLFWYGLKGVFKKYDHPLVWSVILFIIGHCFIGHKEERFLFPVLNALPIIIGFGLPDFIEYYHSCKKWIAGLLKAMLIFSIALDLILLSILTFTPFSQTPYFSYLVKKHFNNKPQTVYCLSRTPLETESGLPTVFYATGSNIEYTKISTNDSVRYLTGAQYVVTTYNQLQNNKGMMDSLGYNPVLYSSKMLWGLNNYLDSKGINTINDIWVLYEKVRPSIIPYEPREQHISFRDAKNIRFSFRAKHPGDLLTVKVDGTLYNDNTDTVRFITMTCDGIAEDLEYDTAEFGLNSFIECNVSNPVLSKIPPKGKWDFEVSFDIKHNDDTMKLGVNFLEPDNSYDTADLSYYDWYKSNHILWSKQKIN